MVDSIGGFAVKIALIQTVPGWESKVHQELYKACKNAGIEDFLFFKGFGTFDIIILYLTDDYGYHLTQKGPIPGVQKANLLLCFPYFSVSRKEFYNNFADSTFIGICLLKVNPGLKNYFPDIDLTIRKFAQDNIIKESILGSLGSHELVIIVKENSPRNILEKLFSLGQLHFEYKNENLSLVLKTLSFLALNYNCLPKKYSKRNTLAFFKNYLLNNSILSSESVNTPDSIFVDCEITVKPAHSKEVKEYFLKEKFSIKDVAGKRDIVVVPPSGASWAHVIAVLLRFRSLFSNEVLSTNTRTYPIAIKDVLSKTSDKTVRVKNIDFSFDNLNKVFGSSMGPALANQFYTLNALINNPLCGFDYADISKSPEYIIKESKELLDLEPESKNGHLDLRLPEASRKLLIAGAELRSYGTYVSVQLSPRVKRSGFVVNPQNSIVIFDFGLSGGGVGFKIMGQQRLEVLC